MPLIILAKNRKPFLRLHHFYVENHSALCQLSRTFCRYADAVYDLHIISHTECFLIFTRGHIHIHQPQDIIRPQRNIRLLLSGLA